MSGSALLWARRAVIAVALTGMPAAGVRSA